MDSPPPSVLRYTVGFGLVEMAISTNPKPTIYRNLYENMGPDSVRIISLQKGEITKKL